MFLQFLIDLDVPVLGRDVKEMGSALTIGCAKSFHRDVKFRDSLQEHGPFMFESAWGFRYIKLGRQPSSEADNRYASGTFD